MRIDREKLQIEEPEYKIYAPDSLLDIVIPMRTILLPKIKEYQTLFGFTRLEQIQINYFDNKEKFRGFIYSLRGENTLPNYASGTYDKGMINAYIKKDINQQTREYKSKLYMANHELFHILYMKYRQKNNCQNNIIWFDEGMAQMLSGEMTDFLEKDTFTDYYEKVRKQTKKIPNLNQLIHGKSFCNEWYNGYDLSYLAVRYLKETLGMNEIRRLLCEQSEIIQYGENIVNEMFAYYDEELYPRIRKR